MILSRAFAALFAVVSFSVFTIGCEDTLPPGVTPEETGPLTIKVVSETDHPVVMSDVRVVVNAADGSIIEEGVTDASGSFVVAEVEAGVSATIATEDSTRGRMLQTRFDLKPNATYTFTAFTNPRVVGTITVTGTNMPSGTFQDVNIGNCRATLGTATQLTEDCVQSDGKVSIYASAYNSNRIVHGRAAKYDLPFVTGMTVNLSDWYSVATSNFNFSAVNGPTAIMNAYFELIAQRRGTEFRFEAHKNGEVSEKSFSGYSLNFPNQLPLPENGRGFQLVYQQHSQTATGLRIRGFLSRKQWIVSPMQIDIASGTPSVEISSLVADLSDGGKPAASWAATGDESADAAILFLQWSNDGKDVSWVGATPLTNGYAKLPDLPASMSGFAPPSSGGILLGPVLITAHSSRISGYDEFAQNESALFLFNSRVTGGSTEATIKFTATLATDFALRTTPSQQKQWPLLRLPATRSERALKPQLLKN